MTIESNPTWQAGYAAGWEAYGDLMIEHLGPDGMVWRPIETAPKDGTEVLVYAPEPWWHSEYGFQPLVAQSSYTSWGGWRYDDADNGTTISPTHWMPLPKPPR